MNFRDCVRQTFQEGGIRSFYKGVGICTFKASVVTEIGFYVFHDYW